MKREKFIKIIKLRSFWKIDHRKGDYKLPCGTRLSDYVWDLVTSQMKLDNLQIGENGDLCLGSFDYDKNMYKLLPDFQESEICGSDEMIERKENLVREIVFG